MAPPSWAKNFVMGSGRRRLENEMGGYFVDFFNDDTNTSQLMRAHLFYLGIIIGLVLISHKAMFVFFEYKGRNVPDWLPRAEI